MCAASLAALNASVSAFAMLFAVTSCIRR